MDLGSYTLLNMDSVKNNAQNTIQYLNNYLGNKLSLKKLVVIFLGETHRNEVDTTVAREILIHPPLLHENSSMLYLERGLEYVGSAEFFKEKQEPFHPEMDRKSRSKLIADTLQEYLINHGQIKLVYIACGDEHATEVFAAMNKRMPQAFTFIHKPSCV